MMADNKTLRANARAALEHKLFGNSWLYAALVMLIYSAIYYLASKILSFTMFSYLVIAAVMGPFNYGLARIFLSRSREGKPIEIRDLFCGFSEDAGESLLLGILTTLFVALWSILLVIPGILKGLSWSQVWFIRQDHPEYTWRECQKKSAEMMEGHRGQYFALMLSFIGWYILGTICLGVGVLWAYAYWYAATAEFYRALTEGTEGPVYTTYEETAKTYEAAPDAAKAEEKAQDTASPLSCEENNNDPVSKEDDMTFENNGTRTGEYKSNGKNVFGEFTAAPAAPHLPDQSDFDDKIKTVEDIPNYTPSLTLEHTAAPEEKKEYVPELKVTGNDTVTGNTEEE